MKRVLAILLLVVCIPAAAQVSGLRPHNHSSAGQGGATLRAADGTSLGPSAADGWSIVAAGDASIPLQVDGASATQSDHLLVVRKCVAGGASCPHVRVTNDLSVISTKACATGYTRVGPNYCFRTGAFSTSSLTRDVCATVASPAADAMALVLLVYVQANAANAIALRTASVKATADDGLTCSSADSTGLWDASAIEEVARTAGTQESINRGTQVVLTSAADNVYLLFSDDTGNQGAAGYRIMGYYD